MVRLCNVVVDDKEYRDKAMNSSGQIFCCFKNLSAEYTYKGRNFCILHLPLTRCDVTYTDNGCDIIWSSVKPEIENLHNLHLSSNRAYIIYEKCLFYVNKNEVFTQISSISSTLEIEHFIKDFNLIQDVSKKLDNSQLAKISGYTNHNYREEIASLKKSAFNRELNSEDEHKRFSFIKMEDITFDVQNLPGIASLIFEGCSLFSIEIRGNRNFTFNQVVFDKTSVGSKMLIEGVNIGLLELKASEFYNLFLIKECKIDDLKIVKCDFLEASPLKRYETSNYGIHIKKCNIHTFDFLRNTTKLMLCISDTEFSSVDLDSDFYITPFLFSKSFFDKEKNVELPTKKRLILNRYYYSVCNHWFFGVVNKIFIKCYSKISQEINYIFSDKEAMELEKLLLKKLDDYADLSTIIRSNPKYYRIERKNLRQLYNIAKARNFPEEMGDYFYLHQKMIQKSKDSSWFVRFINFMYGFSDYGQSITKPVVWLMGIWLVTAYLYPAPKSFLFSLQQMLKPYSLFFLSNGENISKMTYFLGFLESTLSIALVASLIVAIRWHLRKSQD